MGTVLRFLASCKESYYIFFETRAINKLFSLINDSNLSRSSEGEEILNTLFFKHEESIVPFNYMNTANQD